MRLFVVAAKHPCRPMQRPWKAVPCLLIAEAECSSCHGRTVVRSSPSVFPSRKELASVWRNQAERFRMSMARHAHRSCLERLTVTVSKRHRASRAPFFAFPIRHLSLRIFDVTCHLAAHSARSYLSSLLWHIYTDEGPVRPEPQIRHLSVHELALHASPGPISKLQKGNSFFFERTGPKHRPRKK